ncbi:hypothetical protein D3C77_519170 [compost metagenome]
MHQQFGLGCFRARQLRDKAAGDFFFAQDLEQLLQAQRTVITDPAPLKQRLQRQQWRTNLGVDQFAWAKQLPLAHDHAHQQRLSRTRLLAELTDEGLLAAIEQIGIT